MKDTNNSNPEKRNGVGGKSPRIKTKENSTKQYTLGPAYEQFNS